MMLWLRSGLYFVLMLVTVIPYAFLTMLWRPLPLHWRYRLTMGFPRWALWAAWRICGIRWRVEGQSNLPDGPAVLLPKHQSAWETLFLASQLPREAVFVYKRELHWLPFFGWGLAGLSMIAIDRRRGQDAFEQVVTQGTRKLADGRWIVIFPEGTRTLPGSTKRYKTGGARLAVRTGVPVVPIALDSGECWPRQAFVKTPGTITVRIGPPIDTAGRSADEVNASVESWIETEMRKLAPHRYDGPYVPGAAAPAGAGASRRPRAQADENRRAGLPHSGAPAGPA